MIRISDHRFDAVPYLMTPADRQEEEWYQEALEKERERGDRYRADSGPARTERGPE